MLAESETIELKKSTSELKEAVVSMAAMLNKHCKGEIYFGVKNNGVVVGQESSDKTLRDVSRAIGEWIEPKIYPKIKETMIGGKKCIHVEFSGNDTPYFAYGRTYMRVGDENRQLSAKELERIILEKNSETSKWDKSICENAAIKDINSEKAKAFLKKAGLKFTTVENTLKNLELLKNGKLLNAAILFFANNPQKFFRNAKLRCANFPTKSTTTILDRQEHEGDLIYLIEKAEEYILKNIHIGMRIDGLSRTDVPEIDRKAFREAIINAFCHRDYRDDDSIDIAVFKDRVEIRNPGLLYGGLTIQQIKTKMVSERRNKLIADLFHRIRYIEKWGRGIKLILSKEPKTKFEEIGSHFIVSLKRKTAPETPARTKGVTEKVTEKVTENQEKILELISTNRQITVIELAKETGISRKSTLSNISKLKQKKLLKRIGPDKGGYWEISGAKE